jgi:hypothetical protein
MSATPRYSGDRQASSSRKSEKNLFFARLFSGQAMSVMPKKQNMWAMEDHQFGPADLSRHGLGRRFPKQLARLGYPSSI